VLQLIAQFLDRTLVNTDVMGFSGEIIGLIEKY
jgi:hypothetical protein